MSYFRSAGIYALSSALPGAVGFLMLPFYSRFLTTSEFGIIAAMGTVGVFVSAFSNMALDRAALRFYFDAHDDYARKRAFGTFFMGSAMISSLFFILFILMEPLLQLSFPDIDFYPFFFFTIVSSVAGSYIVMLQQYYRVSENPYHYFVLLASLVILQTLLACYFIYVLHWQAFGQVAALFIASAVILPVVCIVAYRNFVFQIDWDILKEGLMFSWPFVPTLLIAWVLNWSDQVFIAHYLSMAEVGVYSMAYKISMGFLMVVAAVSMSFTPYFYKMANSDDEVKAKLLLSNVIKKITYGYILVAFVIALFSFELVTVLLTDQYNEAITLIRILIVSHLLSAIMGVSTNLFFMQAKRSKLQLAIVIVSALVNVLLNYLLIPIYGLYGAALATVFTITFLTIIHYHFSRKCYFIKLPWSDFVKLIVLLGAIVFCVSVLSESLITKLILSAIIFSYVWLKRDWWSKACD